MDNSLRYGGDTMAMIRFSSLYQGDDLLIIGEDDRSGQAVIPNDSVPGDFERTSGTDFFTPVRSWFRPDCFKGTHQGNHRKIQVHE